MPAIKLFSNLARSITAPLGDGFDVSPDNSNDLSYVTRAFMVTGSGDVSVTLVGGSDVVVTGLQPGVVYPFRVVRVKATGTTATGIKGFF